MPGPESPWAAGLLAAVTAGLIDEARIDDKVRRLLRLARRVGALGEPAPVRRSLTPPPPAPAGERALLRRAVAAGTVLLRNERGVLPLDPARLRRVAVIGPSATAVRIQGGGSAEVFPSSVVTPLEGIEAALREAPVGVAPATGPR